MEQMRALEETVRQLQVRLNELTSAPAQRGDPNIAPPRQFKIEARPYSGNREEYPSWRVQTKTRADNAARLGVHADEVTLAVMATLEGSVGRMAHDWYSNQEGPGRSHRRLYEMLDVISTDHSRRDRARSELQNLRTNVGDSLSAHLARFSSLLATAESGGFAYRDEDKLLFLKKSLSKHVIGRYSVGIMQASSANDLLCFLQDIVTHEEVLRATGSNPLPSADKGDPMDVDSVGRMEQKRSRQRGRGGKGRQQQERESTGRRSEGRDQKQDRSSNQDRSSICSWCHKRGHLRGDCYSLAQRKKELDKEKQSKSKKTDKRDRVGGAAEKRSPSPENLSALSEESGKE